MRKSRFTESQIIPIFNEADTGVPAKEIWRKHGISSATFDKWKAKYGGIDVNELKPMKELEGENARLKRMYADLSLVHTALKDAVETQRKELAECTVCACGVCTRRLD